MKHNSVIVKEYKQFLKENFPVGKKIPACYYCSWLEEQVIAARRLAGSVHQFRK